MTPSTAPTHSASRIRRFRRNLLPYALLAPIGALLLAISVYPGLYAIWLAMTDASLLRLARAQFIGLGNFVRAAGDPVFIDSLWRTLRWDVAVVGIELAIALPGHYAIGIFLTALFVLMANRIGWQARGLSPALAFGVCTNVFPWLLMFPAMGYGLFGAHGPAGTRLFVSSLVGHVFFGLGIWLGVRVMSLN